jgi:hypothetical protein
MVDVSEYAEGMTSIQEMRLREHLSKSYELAERLKWCNPDENLNIHKRTITEKSSNQNKEAVVPIISSTFSKHEKAQNAYTELQHTTDEVNINVYDVHYEKDKRSIGVVLEPFDL